MPEQEAVLQQRLAEAISPGFRDRLLDRGLAREMIWQEGILPSDAPPFSPFLSQDLLDYGHALLSICLSLRSIAPGNPILERGFLVAGEALESTVHKGDPQLLDRGLNRITAAVAFHLARYGARAFSILPTNLENENLSPTEEVLALLLKRSLDNLEDRYSSWLLSASYTDNMLANRLQEDDTFTCIDAADSALTTSFMKAMAVFNLSLSNGSAELSARAKDMLKRSTDISAELNMVRHWWTHMLAWHLIDELWEHSLHVRLPIIEPNGEPAGTWNELRQQYILRLLRQTISAVDLWPSQLEAAKRAINPQDTLVVALPTSAGKTRIAELCILRTLAIGKRAIYVTPLRALSAQIERDLGNTFGPLGFVVSSLYGTAGVESVDSEMLKTDKLVVATPEKLDFALRNDSSLINDVGLIVLDEGHMLGPGEREVRYEALVQRLLKRDDAASRRLVCLSALFPEIEKMQDLVRWLRRDDPGEAVHSLWRPTRQRYGWIAWEQERSAARLDVQVETERSFIPRFVSAEAPPQGSRRRRPFPSDKNELTLASGWQFVKQGKHVMVYCARKISVEKLGNLVQDLCEKGLLPGLVVLNESIRDAIAIGKEWLGHQHPAVKCLEYGVGLHHGGLPRQFLSEVERLMRNGDCKLVVASPTIAQGLNLSASVLIVPNLWRGQGKKITPREFANVAGRAGRAFVDLEGLILHVIWEPDLRSRRYAIGEWQKLVTQAKATELESGLLRLCLTLIDRIAKALNMTPQEALAYLPNNSTAWNYTIEGFQRTGVSTMEWDRDIASLDAAMLALLDAETAFGDLESELERVLDGSLFTRQIATIDDQLQSIIRNFLKVRAELMWSETSSSQRKGYYVAGVGYFGGKYLDLHINDLIALLVRSENAVAQNDANLAAENILSIADLVFQTAPFRPSVLPTAWRDALRQWILGATASDVIAVAGEDGVEFLQDGIVYRLAWAMEAIRVHALSLGLEEAEGIEGSAAMSVACGSVNTSVITLVRAGLSSRELAIAAVRSTEGGFESQREMLDWLESPSVQARNASAHWPTVEGRASWLRFLDTINNRGQQRWKKSSETVQIEWLTPAAALPPNSPVVLKSIQEDSSVLVLDPDLTHLGNLRGDYRFSKLGIVMAKVGERQGTLDVSYFGP